MCGGYTRVCVKCGMCGKVEARPLNAAGSCVRCGHMNAPDATHCSECGSLIPKMPGSSMPVELSTPACGNGSTKDTDTL